MIAIIFNIRTRHRTNNRYLLIFSIDIIYFGNKHILYSDVSNSIFSFLRYNTTARQPDYYNVYRTCCRITMSNNRNVCYQIYFTPFIFFFSSSCRHNLIHTTQGVILPPRIRLRVRRTLNLSLFIFFTIIKHCSFFIFIWGHTRMVHRVSSVWRYTCVQL